MISSWMYRNDTGVVDASFCHGASGLAHIANRIYQATRNAEHLVAARTRIVETLEFQRNGGGVAGFEMLVDRPWSTELDLLSGIIGVGLVLLSALTPFVPTWDRMLLCDIPLGCHDNPLS